MVCREGAEVDEEEKDVQVSFIAESTSHPISFKWPRSPGLIWVEMSNLLCIIEQPQPRGQSRRQFILNKETLEMIEGIFNEKKEQSASNF